MSSSNQNRLTTAMANLVHGLRGAFARTRLRCWYPSAEWPFITKQTIQLLSLLLSKLLALPEGLEADVFWPSRLSLNGFWLLSKVWQLLPTLG